MMSALFRRKPDAASAPAQPQTQTSTQTSAAESAPRVQNPVQNPVQTAVRNTAQTAPVLPAAPEGNGFAALGLRAELLRAVAEEGYTQPTPIQVQAIPVVLKGLDVLGGAQTGTGKTAGFVLPMLQRLLANPQKPKSKTPRALVLTPTRELAAQVEESIRTYGKHVPISSTVIYGGVGMAPQVAALRKGVDIVVACPGRLLDHCGERTIDLSGVEIFVLDEADRMLDMGFIHDIKRVLAVLPPKRQNLLFSATFSDEIKTLADRLLNTPTLIEVARRNSTIEVVEQSVVMAEKSQKAKLLQQIISERKWFQVLVFTRTKHGANRLAEQLSKHDIPSLAIHGNKSQGARTKALAEFKTGTLQVLVATDIAARGIDIDQLPHVVNFELPNVPEDYVHRIGRTGRAGATGEALSLVARDELPLLKDIERFIKQAIPRAEIAGFKAAQPDPNAVDEINDRPPLPGRGGAGQRQGRGGRSGSQGRGEQRASNGGGSSRGGNANAGGGSGNSNNNGSAKTSQNAHQQKRSENTRAANQHRTQKLDAVAQGLPPPRTPNLTGAPEPRNYNNGNRNTQRGRTR